MKLKNELYEVTISLEQGYVYYDDILVAHGLEKNDFYSTFCIRIISGGRETTIALKGGTNDTYDDSECAVLEGNVLTILQNDFITGIDL